MSTLLNRGPTLYWLSLCLCIGASHSHASEIGENARSNLTPNAFFVPNANTTLVTAGASKEFSAFFQGSVNAADGGDVWFYIVENDVCSPDDKLFNAYADCPGAGLAVDTAFRAEVRFKLKCNATGHLVTDPHGQNTNPDGPNYNLQYPFVYLKILSQSSPAVPICGTTFTPDVGLLGTDTSTEGRWNSVQLASASSGSEQGQVLWVKCVNPEPVPLEEEVAEEPVERGTDVDPCDTSLEPVGVPALNQFGFTLVCLCDLGLGAWVFGRVPKLS